MFCSKTTRVLFFWRRMERLQAASARSTSTFGTSLLPTELERKKVSVVWCPTGDMLGDYATKPIQGALFRKFRDQIMGVTPARNPGPGKTDGGVGKIETNKNKLKKGKLIRLVPPGKEAAPHDCVGSLTQDRAKLGPGRVKKIAYLTIFNQSKGKSGSYAHVARVGMKNHPKIRYLLHLTS
jgi:hypothetical protein